MKKKKKRIKKKNGIAKWMRSPDGPKHKVIPDKRQGDVYAWAEEQLKAIVNEKENW